MKQMKLLAPVFLLFFFLTAFFAVTARGDFFHDFLNPKVRHTPQFPDSQLYQYDVGIKEVPGSIGCFGDFNSDKYTDIFVIPQNRSSVDVYIWDGDSWKFHLLSSAHIDSPNITNIVATDFNHDGKLDLLVMGNNTNAEDGTTTTYLQLFYGNLDKLTESTVHIPDANDQVLVFDFNNDLFPDFFGELPGSPPTRAFWINKENGTFAVQEQVGDGPLAPLAKPHSNAFVDFNGDCLADLFVTSIGPDNTKQYEVWINRKNSHWQLYQVSPLPLGSGQVTLADFDGDGTTDLCIPVCYPPNSCSTENSVRFVYNKQKPLCSLFNTKKAICRKSTELCSADDSFVLNNITMSNAPGSGAIINIPTSAFGNSTFYYDDAAGKPLTIRTGDYNLDGYMDLLITLKNATGVSHVEIWVNSGTSGQRRFQPVNNGVEQLTSVANVYAAAFFDLDESGNLDVFVLTDNPPRIYTIYNNFMDDALFLKAVGLNGVCPAWCSSTPKFPDPKPYGVNFIGGVFKFTITDLSGKTHLAIGSQLPQSSYLSLSTPYVLFGLGRTSNYIEQFFYGIPLNTKHYQYWTGSTIPNSQVVAIPYKPSEPEKWTLELYTNPSGVMFWVIISVVSSLIVLGVTVFLLYRREKKEDEKLKQDVAHLFSFDAL